MKNVIDYKAFLNITENKSSLKSLHDLDVYIKDGEDTTCPKCEDKTTFLQVDDAKEQHKCLGCGYEFFTDLEDESVSEATTQAKGLDIKNEYTKLINDPDLTTLDLGTVDGVSDTDITNIKQTYKDASIKVIDGHYILSVVK